MTELDRLQKEINGKVVKYQGHDGLEVDVIILAPPEGNAVVAKPYGYTPEQLMKILLVANYRGYSIKDISAPEFCFLYVGVKDVAALDVLKCLASIPKGGSYSLKQGQATREKYYGRADGFFNPSCPYG